MGALAQYGHASTVNSKADGLDFPVACHGGKQKHVKKVLCCHCNRVQHTWFGNHPFKFSDGSADMVYTNKTSGLQAHLFLRGLQSITLNM